MLYFHTFKSSPQQLRIDIVEDIRRINTIAVRAKAAGMIILGGGVVKHHIANACLMRNGAEFAVYINTAQEFDGSDAGARPDEAVSWGKIKMDADNVKVSHVILTISCLSSNATTLFMLANTRGIVLSIISHVLPFHHLPSLVLSVAPNDHVLIHDRSISKPQPAFPSLWRTPLPRTRNHESFVMIGVASPCLILHTHQDTRRLLNLRVDFDVVRIPTTRGSLSRRMRLKLGFGT